MEKNINTIYKKYFNKVVNFISFKIGNKETAEEIAQDVFLRVNKNLTNYDDSISNISTWIFSISKNAIIDHYRKNKVNIVSINETDDDSDKPKFELEAKNNTPYIVMASNELSIKMLNTFRKLPKKYKRITNLHFNHQYKLEQIAELTGTNLNTVKTRMKYVKTFFKANINANDFIN